MENQEQKSNIDQPIFIPLFDIDRNDLYEYDKSKDRTRQRLTEIAKCGMEECGIAQFGYKDVMSGLYIEKVWSYSDEDFNDYMDWVKELIAERSKNETDLK